MDVRALADEVTARTIEIAQIPAPRGAEQSRANVVARWWRDAGFPQVRTDEVGNCWAQVRGGTAPAVVLAAHLDTVFGPEIEHVVKRSGGRLVGPSVGDDSVALAALGAVGRLIAASDGSAPVLLVATVGEEGYGLLAGARHAVAHPPMKLGAFLAIEGNYLGRLGTIGIGSRRWRVVVNGPGGHAWEQSTAVSAVHEAGRLVHALSLVSTVPGMTSLNVGTVEGGEAINAKARRAAFDLELRGVDDGHLEALDIQARSILGSPSTPDLSIDICDAGSRPAGRIDPGHALVSAARAALEARTVAWRETASSTDANAAHAVGLPALALGVTYGAGEHTPQEWIDLAPIADGLVVLADTVARYEFHNSAGGGEPV